MSDSRSMGSLGDHVKGFLSTLSSSHSNSNSPSPPYDSGYSQPQMAGPPYPNQQYGGQQYQQDWQSQNGPPSYYGQPPPQQWPPANQHPQQYNGPQQHNGPPQHNGHQQYNGPQHNGPQQQGYQQQGYQQPPPQGHYNQQPSNGFPPRPQDQQQAGYGQPPSGTPTSLRLREAGSKMYQVADANTGQVLYTFAFSFKSCGSGPVHVMRGDSGQQCGTLEYHSISSNVDMNLGNSYNKDSFFSSGGNLTLEGIQGMLATFRLDKGPGSRNRQGGGIEIHKPGLSQAQLDEIVISGIAELERLRLSSANETNTAVMAAIV